jgi:uncharacterized protein YjbJ (UPF0337 family)
MQFMTNSLKDGITQILSRYEIPMDDRTMILEKVEEEIGSLATAVGKQVQLERDTVRQQVGGFQEQAKASFDDLLGKSKSAVKKAYTMGYQEGLGQGAKVPGPSWFQIAVTVGRLGLAGFVIVREFWPKG